MILNPFDRLLKEEEEKWKPTGLDSLYGGHWTRNLIYTREVQWLFKYLTGLRFTTTESWEIWKMLVFVKAWVVSA